MLAAAIAALAALPAGAQSPARVRFSLDWIVQSQRAPLLQAPAVCTSFLPARGERPYDPPAR